MALTVLTQSSMHNSSVVGFIISHLWLDEAELTQCLMSILYNLIIYCVYITMCWHVELKEKFVYNVALQIVMSFVLCLDLWNLNGSFFSFIFVWSSQRWIDIPLWNRKMISALPVLGGRKSYFPAVSMVIHEDECHNDMIVLLRNHCTSKEAVVSSLYSRYSGKVPRPVACDSV